MIARLRGFYERYRSQISYAGFILLVFVVFGVGFLVTHADTANQLSKAKIEATRKANLASCESLVISRDTLRKVIQISTEPMTDLSALDLPPDPVLGPEFSDAVERVLGRISEAQSDNGDLRDRLLGEAPPLRCTHAGAPVPIEPSVVPPADP